MLVISSYISTFHPWNMLNPTFGGLAQHLNTQALKKNMASSILFTLLNPLFFVVPWYFPLNSTLFPSVFHQNSQRFGSRQDGVQVRLRMHRHLPTQLRLRSSRQVDSRTASTKGMRGWRCDRMWWGKTWEYDTRWCPSSLAKLVYKSNN